ncbi:MAG: hypothetical protein KA198_04165 [Chitinophagaceae bacterium]|nr:hypothetical protein [Chitinophagaceae bacterium]
MKSLYKKILLICLLAGFQHGVVAQIPYQFNYQGVARDITGNPLKNQKLAIKLAILPDINATQSEFEEIQHIETNEFGLYQLKIGSGQSLYGSMIGVKWESGNKYIRVSLDPNDGNEFNEIGITQLLSVPYAIYAEKAGLAKEVVTDENTKSRAGIQHYLSKFNSSGSSSEEINSQIFDNGTNIGIGTNTPDVGVKVQIETNSSSEFIRMRNKDTIGFGSFSMYNDIANKYATFTKYGSLYPGGYNGIEAQYPYANMLAFGNNGGPFLLSTSGNIGISIYKSNFSKLKFNVDFNSENVGIGGSALPAAQVHFNQNTIGDTLKLTNGATGHAFTDGLDIYNNGNASFIMNRENSTLTLGANNISHVQLASNGKTEVLGALRIAGGNPGVDKILTSDANGNASWKNLDTANGNSVWKTNGNIGLSTSQFIGTQDTQAIKFKVNNSPFGYLSNGGNIVFGKNAMPNSNAGNNNIALGLDAMKNNQSLSNNVAIGSTAMREFISGGINIAIGGAMTQGTILTNNVAIGNAAGGYQTKLSDNVFIGNNTGVPNYGNGYGNTFLKDNIAIGSYAFASIGKIIPDSQTNNIAIGTYALAGSNAIGNIAIGTYAGRYLSTNNNIAIGNDALTGGCTGNANTAIGWKAYKSGVNIQSSISVGYNSNETTISGTGNTTIGVAAAGLKNSGDRNCYIGWHSGIRNITGNDNVFVGVHVGGLQNNTSNSSSLIGSYAGYNLSTGTENTSLGFETLFNTTSGSDNIAIGYQAGKFMTTQSNVIAIGYQAGANNTQSNRVIIGYNELPRFANAADAAANLPSSGPNGVYVYWNTTTNQIMVNP